MRRWMLLAAALLVACGLGFGGWRVFELESNELEAVSDWQPLAPTLVAEPGGGERFLPHRELGSVRLEKGEAVTFEVCARDRLEPSQWAGAGLEIAVWIPATKTVVVRRPLDAEALDHVTRGPERACLVIAQGDDLAEGGEYVIEAVWPERGFPVGLNLIAFRSRVLAYRAAPVSDRWSVLVILVGALLFVGAFLRRPAAEDREPEEEGDDEELVTPRSHDTARVVAAVGALVAAGFALALVPLAGSFWGLARAVCLVLVQVAVVAVLVRKVPGLDMSRLRAIGLHGPAQRAWIYLVAVAAGLALWLLGQVALSLIPATGVSTVGAMVVWPSGSLAVALASVLAPVAEEVFFRGFIFGAVARRHGAAMAFVATSVIFALAHLPQSWGAWGGLTAIMLTGVGLTALRLWTGSTVVPIIAHLAHNSAITLGWVLIARG